MRFFIALEITNENLAQIQQIQQSLSNLIPQAKLTNPDKLHLTLAFIGEQPDYLKTHLIEVLNKAVEGISRFSITPSYINAFPNLHNPHVLWLGVNGQIDKLIIIQQRLTDNLADLHLPLDTRPFTPHITIAKLNNTTISHKTAEELRQLMNREFIPMIISSIKLFESVPEGGLHQHNTLAEIQLK